jgi:hypothetical protein
MNKRETVIEIILASLVTKRVILFAILGAIVPGICAQVLELGGMILFLTVLNLLCLMCLVPFIYNHRKRGPDRSGT